MTYLETVSHWVTLLWPYYDLSTNTASLGHPPLAPIMTYLKTVSYWVTLVWPYYDLSKTVPHWVTLS